jgi:predicted transcriptional regulator
VRGNTSAASIPLLLDECNRAGRFMRRQAAAVAFAAVSPGARPRWSGLKGRSARAAPRRTRWGIRAAPPR